MEKSAFFEYYKEVFAQNGLSQYATDAIVETMFSMVEHMLAVNENMNLTAITDWREVVVKHLADCCAVLSYIPEGARVLDVGCGGGFPSLPMAIARPDLEVVGVDSTGKKVDYINLTANLLGLDNLSAVCGRAEDLANGEMREAFDVVTARAVAALPILCELCVPFVKKGGLFCAMKGARGEEELNAAKNAYRKLGAPLDPSGVHCFELGGETRYIVVAEKIAPTPQSYPRPYPQIKKKPL